MVVVEVVGQLWAVCGGHGVHVDCIWPVCDGVEVVSELWGAWWWPWAACDELWVSYEDVRAAYGGHGGRV